MSFFGLEISRKAVLTQQAALDITGHNIANANTPGFTRQTAVMVTTRPSTYLGAGAGQMGSGVTIEEIRRLRDAFADSQYRQENITAGYWESMQAALDKAEMIMNEPSDNGLRSVMDKFWVSLEKLSESPESLAVRSTVIESAQALADAFHHMDNQYQELQEDLNQSVYVQVQDVNSLAQQIAELNQQIMDIKMSGQTPNDLSDKRDYLIDQLTRLADVQVREDQSGVISVFLGGRVLVNDTQAYALKAQRETTADSQGFYNVVWANDGLTVDLHSGSIKGLIDARGTWNGSGYSGTVPELRKQLDNLAQSITLEMNAVHQAGYGLDTAVDLASYQHVNLFKEPVAPGPNFSWASFFSLTDEVVANPEKLAAAQDYETLTDGSVKGLSGDGSNALALANIKQKTDHDPAIEALIGDTSYDDYWRSSVAELGIKAQEAQRMSSNQSLLLNQLENKRQQTAGVSIDEEMTNMIKFQHAYNAAARMLTAVDEMLDVLINRLGVVGR